MAMLKERDLRLRHSYGQNFLIDGNMLDICVTLAGVTRGCGVIEVGPGIGNLTSGLARAAGRVRCFEIDRRLEPLLLENLAGIDNVEVVFADVMKCDLAAVCDAFVREGMEDIKVVSNLPYSITTPFVLGVLREHPRISALHLMIQKEVAQRFTAPAGSPQYSFASVAAGLHAEIRIDKTVNRNCFFPVPDVTSALVSFRRRPEVPDAAEERKILGLAKILFTERRKTIKTVLSRNGLLGPDNGKAAGLAESFDLGRRAETLSVEEFCALSRALESA